MNSSAQGSVYYPISLNIMDKQCKVIGGGEVALRKVNMLLEFGAIVEVISDRFCPELVEMGEIGKVNLIRRRYIQGDLEGAVLAIAATNDADINQEISLEARGCGTLINVVDDPEKSAFIVPSYLRRGTVTISVSTGGSSPALARNIREKLERIFVAEYASLAILINEVRTELKNRGVKIDSENWQKALDTELLLSMLKEGHREEAKGLLLDKLEKAGIKEL